jgi:hypothetical protein
MAGGRYPAMRSVLVVRNVQGIVLSSPFGTVPAHLSKLSAFAAMRWSVGLLVRRDLSGHHPTADFQHPIPGA